jgi:ferritin-like protein
MKMIKNITTLFTLPESLKNYKRFVELTVGRGHRTIDLSK